MFHALLPLAAAVAPAPPVTVDATTLFDLAAKAEASGRPDDAETMYRALARDPDDDLATEARYRLAKMLVRLGRKTDAAVLLREVVDRHPEAAPARLELAALLATMGDEDRARTELRQLRAGELPPEVASFVDRFSAALRASRPLGGTIKLGILADSNVNRATRSDTLGTIIGDFTLSEDARASSGRGLNGDGQAFARVRLGGQALLATVSGSADLYRNANFNDVSIAARVGPELHLRALQLVAGVGKSRRWFGGARLTDATGIQIDTVHAIGPKAQGRLGLSVNKVDYRLNALQDGWHFGLSTQVERAIGRSTGAGLFGSLLRQELADAGQSSWSGQAGAFGWRQIGRASVTASASLGRLTSDRRIFLYPERREDRSRRISLGVTARGLSVAGFAPTAQLSREATRSTVSIYDYRRTAVELGITRAF